MDTTSTENPTVTLTRDELLGLLTMAASIGHAWPAEEGRSTQGDLTAYLLTYPVIRYNLPGAK